MLLFFVLSTVFNAFVIHFYKSLQCIVNIVVISSNIVHKYCLGYVNDIDCHIVILNSLYCLYSFCAKLWVFY
jgi:hypothetical protein